MLKLDGSKLEGGGQLTRMALCLSAITGKPIKIHAIRAGRGAKSSRSNQIPNKRDRRSDKSQKGGRLSSSDSTTTRSPAGGLKESHLAALRWLAAQTYADFDGGEVGSTEVVFRPGAMKGKYGPDVLQPVSRDSSGTITDTIQLKNPGSVWLIFQAIYPFMVFGSQKYDAEEQTTKHGLDKTVTTNEHPADDEEEHVLYDLTLIGGTNVPKSMSTEYVQQVFLPICELIGLPRVHIETIKSGWTTGSLEVGKVKVRMYFPSTTSSQTRDMFRLPPFSLTERGSITKISITIVSTPHLFPTLSDLLTSVVSSHTTFQELESQPTIEIHSTHDSGHERRLYILLVAHTSTGLRLGRDFLGSGSKPKNVKEEESLLAMSARAVVDGLMCEIEHGACVDEYMQDQIVALQALAAGPSQVRGREGGGKDDGWGGVCDSEGDENGESESLDRSGTLHTRTVRWVCEQIVDGVKFLPGGHCRK